MENRRVRVGKDFLQMDLSNTAQFEDLVFLFAEICQTPVASITFVDDKRQYPVVGRGPVIESSADTTFFKHTIRCKDVLEIPDALNDPRFVNNPLVTSHPHIRFYAGAPLETTDGITIGLCVIDKRPKKLTISQIKSLEILAKQVMLRLELKLCEEKIRVQGDVLSEISQIHSHEIRHPLTNILGIIDIIKQEGLNKQYIVFLEAAARELDSVIRKVVSNGYEADYLLNHKGVN